MTEKATRAEHTSLAWEPLLYPLIFGVALILRILQLGVFVVGDELGWAFRVFQFWQALARYPVQGSTSGVTGTVTLWVSSAGLALQERLQGLGVLSRWQALAGLGTFDAQNPDHLRLVASFWPLAKLPGAVLSAALIIVLAFLVARLWGARAGLFAGLLLTVTPPYLALSRIMAPDALTAALALSGLLALLWALRKPRRWVPWVLSGVLAGLAIVNQNAAALLVPYALLLVAVAHLAQRRPALLGLRNGLLWGVAALASALLAYPATWTAPVAAGQRVLAHIAAGLVLAGRPPAGRADWLALGLSTMPLSCVGVALAVLELPIAGNRRRLPVLAVLAFAVATVLLTPGNGRGALGMLLANMALAVVAAAGLDGVPAAARRLFDGRGSRLALLPDLGLSLIALVIVGWQVLAVARYYPYYPAYRNPWLAARAPLSTYAGGGEGMDRVAAYLNDQPNAEHMCVATSQLPSLAPFFVGQAVPLSQEAFATADFTVIYNRDWLWPNPLLQQLPAGPPEQSVRLHGIEYARIYANRRHEPIVQFLDEQVRPDDIIILDAPSPFGRHYRGAAPYKEIKVESPGQVAAELTQQAFGRWRLWHVAFAGSDPEHIVDDMLEMQAMLLGRQEVPGAVISTYLLPLQPHFSALAPDQPLDLEFAQGLVLRRAGLAESRVQYRQKIGVLCEWFTRSKPAGNIALSLRLVDDQGRLWAQEDHWIVDGNGRSTAAWGGGDSARSLHTLAVPPGIPPGPYRLRMVLYAVDSLQPLLPADPGRTGGNPEVDLTPLEILPAQMPPTLSELKLAHPLQVTLGNGVELLGCDIGAQTVQAGQELPLRLWWRTTHPVTITYQAHLMLLDAKGNERGDRLVELAGSQHPTTAWIGGEVIEGRYSLDVSAEAAAGEALVGVELIDMQGPAGEAIRLGTVQVEAPEHVFAVPKTQHPRQETFDQKVRLLGYDLEPAKPKPGQALQLTLYWQDLAPMKTGYTVFTHLLAPDGQIVAGHDGIPAGSTRPTTGWVLHEVLVDRHEITIPANAAPGRYTIEVGLYQASTGARLPAYNASTDRLAQDRVLLATVTVE